jgi:hypothetical protein
MSELDIRGVLNALDSEGVSFVLIGAVALAAHGPIRATEDVDIVPDPDPENLRVLGNALVGMRARLAADPTREIDQELRTALAKGDGLTLETEFGGLDVVQRFPGVPTFQDLIAEASRMRLLGIDVNVCSRRHLREMKMARGSHRDLADVEDLDSLEDTG